MRFLAAYDAPIAAAGPCSGGSSRRNVRADRARVDVGRAFVGNVGAGDVKDFTVLGDVVNTAARLQSSAAGGQIVMSERLFGRLPSGATDASSKNLAIKGKREAEPVRVIDLGADIEVGG